MSNNLGILTPGEQLSPTNPTAPGAKNNGLCSPNAQFQLQYQNDGNLVLYKYENTDFRGPRHEVQKSNTNTDLSDYFNSYAVMKDDGNFEILHESDAGTFSTQCYWKGPEGSSLHLDNSGDLFLQGPDGSKESISLSDYQAN